MVWRVFGAVLFRGGLGLDVVWAIFGVDVLGLVAGVFVIPVGALTIGAFATSGTGWFGQPRSTRVMASFSAGVTHSRYFFFTLT